MMRPGNSDARELVEDSFRTLPAAVLGDGLVKRYGRSIALDGLGIRAPQGSVYALLGRNGAGKSTLIGLAMGMLAPARGRISVLGLDPMKQEVALKQRVGYVPDRLPMYEWMTVDEIVRFTASFYPNWSRDDEDDLIKRFRIDRTRKVGSLSRGYRALLSLVLAMAHRPELVILDECTAGMDAIARREFERCVIDALQSRGRAVLFAGHQIDEMERICDYVGILHQGRMLLEMPLDRLKATVKLLQATAAEGQTPALSGGEILSRRQSGRDLALIVRLDRPDALPEARGARIVDALDLTLEEIFVALAQAEDEK